MKLVKKTFADKVMDDIKADLRRIKELSQTDPECAQKMREDLYVKTLKAIVKGCKGVNWMDPIHLQITPDVVAKEALKAKNIEMLWEATA